MNTFVGTDGKTYQQGMNGEWRLKTSSGQAQGNPLTNTQLQSLRPTDNTATDNTATAPAITATSVRGVETGGGKKDYIAVELSNGNTVYLDSRVDRPAVSVGDDYEGFKNANFSTNKDVADYENYYTKTFGQPIEREQYGKIINAGATNKIKKATELMKAGDAVIDSNGDVKMNSESLFKRSDDGKSYKYLDFDTKGNPKLNAYAQPFKTLNLINTNEFNTQAQKFTSEIPGVGNYVDPNATVDKVPNVELPDSLKTIRDLAVANVIGGAPAFDPKSIAGYDTAIEGIYKPYEDKLKGTLNDRWASLFPEGGGTTSQLQKDNQLFAELNATRKAEALAMAKDAYNKKYGEYQYSQKQVQDIGLFEGSLGMYNTTAEANKAALDMTQGWDQTKYYTGLDYQNLADIRDARLGETQSAAYNNATENYSDASNTNAWVNTGVTAIATII
jgi:hypothetical protein